MLPIPKFAAVAILATTIPAKAHDWYPQECCSNKDCAPAYSIKHIDHRNIQATTKFGTAIFGKHQIRPSKDCQYHACMRQHWTDKTTRYGVCLFVPTCS